MTDSHYSLESFESGLSEVRLLLDIPGKSDTSPAQANALRRAAVVLLVSHFESYLKSIAEEFIDQIGDGRLESRRIPLGIRELHTLPRLSAIMETNDSIQRGALLKNLSNTMALWNESAKPSRGTLKPELLSRQVTSANAESIDKLFALMGHTSNVCDGDIDIHGTGDNMIESSSIRLGLKDVVKCRNDIAHGDIDRQPTKEDSDRYLRFLCSLASRLQRKADALTGPYMSVAGGDAAGNPSNV